MYKFKNSKTVGSRKNEFETALRSALSKTEYPATLEKRNTLRSQISELTARINLWVVELDQIQKTATQKTQSLKQILRDGKEPHPVSETKEPQISTWIDAGRELLVDLNREIETQNKILGDLFHATEAEVKTQIQAEIDLLVGELDVIFSGYSEAIEVISSINEFELATINARPHVGLNITSKILPKTVLTRNTWWAY